MNDRRWSCSGYLGLRQRGSKPLEKQRKPPPPQLAPKSGKLLIQKKVPVDLSPSRELGHHLPTEVDGQKVPSLPIYLTLAHPFQQSSRKESARRVTIKTENTVEDLGFVASGVRSHPGAWIGILLKAITEKRDCKGKYEISTLSLTSMKQRVKQKWMTSRTLLSAPLRWLLSARDPRDHDGFQVDSLPTTLPPSLPLTFSLSFPSSLPFSYSSSPLPSSLPLLLLYSIVLCHLTRWKNEPQRHVKD